MADPFYGAAPRQESTVIRTQAEYDAMREAQARKIREAARAARKEAQAASGYNDYAYRYKDAPSVAEIMAQTGATAEQAVDIRRYQDWDNYGDWSNSDLTAAQSTLADPNRVAPEFEWKFTEPDRAGQILPYYLDRGNGDLTAYSLLPISGSGEIPSPIGLGNSKDEFYREAMGYGVGTAGLDMFARRFGAQDWDSLNWERQVKQNQNLFDANGKYTGTTNMWRGDPTKMGDGSYAVRGPGWDFASIVKPDGSSQSMENVAGTPFGNIGARDDWFKAIGDYQSALRPIGVMNADFAQNMAGREDDRLRAEQGYQSLIGNGFAGGLINDSYSNPFFGQITGREAAQSPFTMSEQGPYPWSTPTQQLDLASLMSPAYGGPNGGRSMGGYGGQGWGGNQKIGGLGSLGGFSAGPFGAKSPWSPA